MDTNSKKLPVFVFPGSLKIYLNYRNTHKTLLTLYNPYDFPVRFKVLCTSPTKYTVVDPEGSIGPQACVDLVVRHVIPIPANCNVTDKFRVQMLDHTTRQFLGKRDVEAVLLPGEPDNNSDAGDNFHSLPHSERQLEELDPAQYPAQFRIQRRQRYSDTTNYIALILGLISIIALILPIRDEKRDPTSIPTYLHVSVNSKILFSYVLGIVCMVLFQPRA